ncbi:MAG TPA: hypothetical protein VK698_04305 [Kofleriaceae bacterium]|nr:hypothetical protein [Kofleriaceae bacterium]
MLLGPSSRLLSCLFLATTAGCSGGGGPIDDPDDDGEEDTGTDPGDKGDEVGSSATVAKTWGRLASPGHERDPVVATLFFAGEARDGSKQYEYSAASNVELFTEWPADERLLRWSSDPSSRLLALDQMVEAGVNVVLLSNWGPRGSDAWSKWAPMQTSTYAHDEVMSAIGYRPLLVVPFLESNPEWAFRSDFPGTAEDPAPGLVERIVDLVDRDILHPQDPAWPGHWARIYGPDGQPRLAIAIIHASSDSALTDEEYADGLDRVADEVEAQTGQRVGFLLDALPPESLAPGRFFPAPARTARPMKKSSSVLGVSCFLPEIWSGIGSDPDDVQRLAWKRDFITGWVASGVPTLVDVSAGYDASIVFPGSVRYGHTPAWREALRQMVAELGDDGVVLNSWNGYTEAMSMVPTVERGDAVYRWAADLANSVALP